MKLPFGERNVMLIFLALSVGASLISLTFQLPEARDFPLYTGIATTVIILIYFALVRSPVLKERFRAFIEDDIFMKITAAAGSFEEDEAEEAQEVTHVTTKLTDEVRRQREKMLIGYLVGFGVLAWAIGLVFAAPIFMVAIMIGYSAETWRTALLVTAGTSIMLYLVFTVLLRQPPHLGLLDGLF